jgi:peptidyl-prolyl cis-trans isomerase SurA
MSANDLQPELRAVAERLQTGQVSLPIRTPAGVYIIAMRERREGAPVGSVSLVTLRQITAPAARSSTLERLQRRVEGCNNLESQVNSLDGASMIDLGQTVESELSPAIRARLEGVSVGAASRVAVDGDQASVMVLCARQSGGQGVPDRTEIENRLREAELTMLAERYLRNLRREATIITRQ